MPISSLKLDNLLLRSTVGKVLGKDIRTGPFLPGVSTEGIKPDAYFNLIQKGVTSSTGGVFQSGYTLADLQKADMGRLFDKGDIAQASRSLYGSTSKTNSADITPQELAAKGHIASMLEALKNPEIFNKFDMDRNGILDKKDLDKFAKKGGDTFTFNPFDQDESKVIDETDFKDF
jgi:hypothetical protein